MPIFEFSSPPTPQEIEEAQKKIDELEQDGMKVALQDARRELAATCYTYLSIAEQLSALHDLADVACRDMISRTPVSH